MMPRAMFDRVLDDEPPMQLSLEPVVAQGRRVRRRRHVMYAAAAAVTTAVVAVGTVTIVRMPAAPTPPATSATPYEPDPALTPEQRAVARAIVDSSPDGWTFDLSAERWDAYGVEAEVDDGQGRARLRVDLARRLNDAMCLPEYPDYAGETCLVTTTDDGAEVRRRQFTEARLTYVEGTLKSPELVVTVITGNHTMTWPTPRGMPEPNVTRAGAPYTLEQLEDLLAGVARAAREARYPATDRRPPTMLL